MAFQRIDLLGRYDPEAARAAKRRWETDEGRLLEQKILAMIRAGGGEDFLQWDYESENLGFLESQWDLAGLKLFNETIDFPEGITSKPLIFHLGSFGIQNLTTLVFHRHVFILLAFTTLNFEIASSL